MQTRRCDKILVSHAHSIASMSFRGVHVDACKSKYKGSIMAF